MVQIHPVNVIENHFEWVWWSTGKKPPWPTRDCFDGTRRRTVTTSRWKKSTERPGPTGSVSSSRATGDRRRRDPWNGSDPPLCRPAVGAGRRAKPFRHGPSTGWRRNRWAASPFYLWLIKIELNDIYFIFLLDHLNGLALKTYCCSAGTLAANGRRNTFRWAMKLWSSRTTLGCSCGRGRQIGVASHPQHWRLRTNNSMKYTHKQKIKEI